MHKKFRLKILQLLKDFQHLHLHLVILPCHRHNIKIKEWHMCYNYISEGARLFSFFTHYITKFIQFFTEQIKSPLIIQSTFKVANPKIIHFPSFFSYSISILHSAAIVMNIKYFFLKKIKFMLRCILKALYFLFSFFEFISWNI